jgi:hypothetical protein
MLRVSRQASAREVARAAAANAGVSAGRVDDLAAAAGVADIDASGLLAPNVGEDTQDHSGVYRDVAALLGASTMIQSGVAADGSGTGLFAGTSAAMLASKLDLCPAYQVKTYHNPRDPSVMAVRATRRAALEASLADLREGAVDSTVSGVFFGD